MVKAFATFLEPSTTAGTTTDLTGIVGAALGTNGARFSRYIRCRSCCSCQGRIGETYAPRCYTSTQLDDQINYLTRRKLPSQASKPSVHVCSNFELPGLPHCLNQDPPQTQQLSLLALLVPQVGHTVVLSGDMDAELVVINRWKYMP